VKRLLLAGGGHAHLSVLRRLAEIELADVEITLVTPSTHQTYSGMLPGWMAGHYTLEQCQIDLRPLADGAQIHMELGSIVDVDAGKQFVVLQDGRVIAYDFLSLDTGSEIDTSWLEMADEKLLPVKPLDRFSVMWPRLISDAGDQPEYRLVIVGGGAAGVELALAARHAFSVAGLNRQIDLVVSESGLLVGHASGVQQRVTRFLGHANVVVHRLSAAGANEGVSLSDGTRLPADCVIAATGARAPGWLKQSALGLDKSGYVAVDGQHRSCSHPNVFAAGDICARQDMSVGRSGVHAVHAGPVLAVNLLAALKGGETAYYKPHRRSLYLLACGPRYAIASWGRFSAEGQWVWRWKDWIDRRFITRFKA
jgi:pyridine nucleotide-disulfide oxidoreductase family protein